MALHPLDILRLTHVLTTPTPDDHPGFDGGDTGSNSTFSGGQGQGVSSQPINLPTPSPNNPIPNSNFDLNPGNPQTDNKEDTNFQPEHTATDKFNSLIDSYPQENKPGLLRKIFGTVAGTLAGKQAEEETLHPGRDTEIKDWENKIKPAEQAANLERYSNVNERTMAHQTAETQRRTTADQALETSRQNHETNLLNIATNKNVSKEDLQKVIDQHKLDLAELTAKHAKELAELNNKSKGDIADKGDQTKKDVANINAGSREKVADKKNANALTLSTYKGQQIQNKPETANNEQQRMLNNVDIFKRDNPNLAQHINVDPNTKEINVRKPGPGGMFSSDGPSQADYDKINKFINENGKSGTGGNSNTNTSKVAAPPEFGKDKDIKFDGNEYTKELTMGAAKGHTAVYRNGQWVIK